MLRPIGRLKDYIMCAVTLGANPKNICSILWRETKNVRVHLNLGTYNPQQVYTLQTIYGPLHFRDNFGDITNLIDLFYHQEYRVRRLAGGGIILDVGANIGLAAAWFAYHNPGRSIWCFEPLAANANLIALNCPSAKVVQVAVGARRGRIKLQVDPDQVMASNIPCRWETQEEEFDVISLDEFTNVQDLERIALLKIDVEGMEVEILQGCRKTLSKTHQVVLETHGRIRHYEVVNSLLHSGLFIDSEQFGTTTGLVFASRRN